MSATEISLDIKLLTTQTISEGEVQRAWEAAKRQYKRALADTGIVKYASDAANTEPTPATWNEFSSANLEVLLSDLGSLLQSRDYNENFIRPTNYAIDTAWGLLINANRRLKGALPLGTIYPDGDGGIRIEWIREGLELRSIIPGDATGRSYIYHEASDQYEADHNVSADSLGYWLEWFNKNERGAR